MASCKDFEAPRTSSSMSPEQAEACIGDLPGLVMQTDMPGAPVSPHWGIFHEVLERLPENTLGRIRGVVNLVDRGDIARPEKTIVRLAPERYIEMAGRGIRSVKLKGISNRLLQIKRGEARHIRLLGRGDIPSLVPYLNREGEEQLVAYDAGEPYGAKRFRSTVHETLVARYALSHGRSVLIPIGVGIYRDPDLFFKGEPAGFSIWGVEHPDDERFDASWRQRFEQHLGNSGALLEVSLDWTRDHLRAILAEARQYHAIGLVHHEPQLDNHAFYEGSLSVLDWEEAAHWCQLSRAQFLESVLIDLFKLICYCGVLESEHRLLFEQQGFDSIETIAARGTIPDNWFLSYFEGLSVETEAMLHELLPMGLRDREKRGAFRTRVLPLLEDLYGDGRFGQGIDWQDVARPFAPGFSADAPIWQAQASTTFDPRLFLRKGARGLPGSDEASHPSSEIKSAEEAIYDGDFGAARRAYARLLEQGSLPALHRQYVCHNLSSLCFALHRDAQACAYFEQAYPGSTGCDQPPVNPAAGAS